MTSTTCTDPLKSQQLTIEGLSTAAYNIPTDLPESDGTLEWDWTTLVVVHVHTCDEEGFGYTYAPAAAAHFIQASLRTIVIGQNAFATEHCWRALVDAVRNAGQPGLAFTAISAIDTALWDLKARILSLPLCQLWGMVREEVPLYGSGGFTSYDDRRLAEQLAGWAENGFTSVKMKVGRDPQDDPRRLDIARRAIGEEVELFVDANGAYSPKQALAFAHRFADESGVVWFEEPTSSDDLDGLRLLRDHGPAGMDIAAGEYGYTPWYFREMLEAGAVDCLQADVSRCGGYTGFFKVAALCEAFHMPLSAHCAPQLHAHLGCCIVPLRHLEYFHDHARIADMLFDGRLEPVEGCLRPDLLRPGHGLSLKRLEAERFAV